MSTIIRHAPPFPHLFHVADVTPPIAQVRFIHTAIAGGGAVYVHCHQGVSRSSSMVIAYLMWKHSLGRRTNIVIQPLPCGSIP